MFLTNSQIQAILQFLSRVQLTGAEAPAFMECVRILNEYLKKENEVKE